VSFLALGKAVEHVGQLGHDFGIERGDALAQLRPAERRHADLGEEDAAVAIGGKLDEKEIETARERALRIEHAQLRAQRLGQIAHDLIDGRDQQVFLRDEVVVHEPGREIGLGRNALDGGTGDPMLQDRRAQTLDDLAAARTGETRASHR